MTSHLETTAILRDRERIQTQRDTALSALHWIAYYPFDVNSDAATDLRLVRERAQETYEALRG